VCPVIAWSDADFATDPDQRKSRTGFVIKVFGCPVMWRSRLQSIIAASTTEAEYVALFECVRETQWLRKLVEEIGFYTPLPIRHFEDNSAVISITKDPVHTGRTKGLDVQHHIIRKHYDDGDADYIQIPTDEMFADMYTKALPPCKQGYHRGNNDVFPSESASVCHASTYQRYMERRT
jgi:hypothetical protein